MTRGRPPNLVCVLAETRLDDATRIVTQDLFPQYEWKTRGIPGAVRAANSLKRYHTVRYRDRERIGRVVRTRTWQEALRRHFTEIVSLRLEGTGLRPAEGGEDWWWLPEGWRTHARWPK